MWGGVTMINGMNEIIEIVGKQGTGKTLLMTSMATHKYKPQGYLIGSNMHSYKFNDFYFAKIDDIKAFEPDRDKKYLFLLDEVASYSNLDSRMSMTKGNINAIKVLTQLRKKRISLIYTMQFLGNDKRFRSITDTIYFLPDAKLYPKYAINFDKRLIYYTKGYFQYETGAIVVEQNPKYYKFYEDDIKNYDTYEIIEGEDNDNEY